MIINGASETAVLSGPTAGLETSGTDAALPTAATEGRLPANDIRAVIAAERARIAREMQDSVANSLADIAQAAASLLPPERPTDPDLLDRRLRELVRLARHAVAASQRAIGELGDEERTPNAGPGASKGLTPREMEIMGLIAAGLSNRQIAAQLVISPKTVKNHICNIYQRIGIHERRQAISFWREL